MVSCRICDTVTPRCAVRSLCGFAVVWCDACGTHKHAATCCAPPACTRRLGACTTRVSTHHAKRSVHSKLVFFTCCASGSQRPFLRVLSIRLLYSRSSSCLLPVSSLVTCCSCRVSTVSRLVHLGLFFCHALHSVAHISLVLFCSHRRAHRCLHTGFQTTEQYLKVSDCVDISISRRVVDTLGAREHAPGEVILARTPLQVWILTAWWCVPEAFLCQVLSHGAVH